MKIIKEVEKITVKEIEKPIIQEKEVEKIIEVESEGLKIENRRLKQTVQELEGKLNSKSSKLIQDKNRLEKWQLGLVILLILKGLIITGLVAKLLRPNKKK